MTETRVCIAGGGPAGMMLGLLLARAGIDVVVLEKHADFLRDFRGDTVHPSTMQVMHELGLLESFLSRPHDPVDQIGLMIGSTYFEVANFRRLAVVSPFIAMMPQWHFLNFLAEEAGRYPTFHLMMQAEATGLVRSGGVVTGVEGRGADGPFRIDAELVIAADGRHSTLRAVAGLTAEDQGSEIDVLWMRLPRQASDPPDSLGRIDAGRMLVTINRGDYWQCAFVIAKGGIRTVHAAGLPALRNDIVRIAPHFADRVDQLAYWDEVKLLTVAVNRLPRWDVPGMLCIGDAAHAMSPIGGVGVNLAIQDAVATANVLVPAMRNGSVSQDDLRTVQKRRDFPTKATQRLQLLMQDRIITAVLRGTGTINPPLPLRLLRRFPWLRRFPARIIGMGFRPEHIRH